MDEKIPKQLPAKITGEAIEPEVLTPEETLEQLLEGDGGAQRHIRSAFYDVLRYCQN